MRARLERFKNVVVAKAAMVALATIIYVIALSWILRPATDFED